MAEIKSHYREIRLILGDQLNSNHSWFKEVSTDVLYVLAELKQESTYVKHHIQKICAFFAGMRAFAAQLEAQGQHVLYVKINDPRSENSFANLLVELAREKSAEIIRYQLPDEYRLDAELAELHQQSSFKIIADDTEHFLTSRTDFKNFFAGKKQFLMERFYRNMREKHRFLMDGSAPEGGKWNFDHDNRKKYKNEVPIPKPQNFANDVTAIYEEIQQAQLPHFGTIDASKLIWPITRSQALGVLKHFCEALLPYFGTYEDAMHGDDPFLFHSRLSFAMNAKLLSPTEVIEASISAYRSNDKISIAQIEGFVRQIAGWREYVRGLYWKEMPNYAQLNHLENQNPLPEFYWTGNTKMNCLRKSISQSLSLAYAHHIQRLMVIGNFSLLTQLHPDAVDAWYLGIYIDAIEWVELPNTRGMSQWADGGIIATKPYVSSGSYINKMSDYCGKCAYNVKERVGENACPFNALYWNFLDEKQAFFKDNQRMSMMLALLKKIPAAELAEIKLRAAAVIANPDRF